MAAVVEAQAHADRAALRKEGLGAALVVNAHVGDQVPFGILEQDAGVHMGRQAKVATAVVDLTPIERLNERISTALTDVSKSQERIIGALERLDAKLDRVADGVTESRLEVVQLNGNHG